MALYCDGKDCEVKENCYRYTEGKRQVEKGFANGVWFTNKKECETNKDFFYVKRNKDFEK